tara:strand:+ start:1531 stop:2763 length:1233 start_codon:yes stop_codon:yes gene_type:complete
MSFKLFGYTFGSSSTRNEKGDQSTRPHKKAFTRSKKPTLDEALQLSSFWCAVNRWATTLSSLPIQFQTRDGENWVKDVDSDLGDLFSGKVNRYQTKAEFFKEIALNLFSNGNSYAHIQRDGNKITSLLPLSSTQMEVRVLDNGEKVFMYEHDGNITQINAENVWHLMLFGNNVVGLSPLAYGANTVGVGLSADERITQTLDNAAKPSGILTFDNSMGELTGKQRDQLKEEFKSLKEGTDNVLMTLESGWGYKQVGLNPQDIQLFESRRFTIEDIGRFLDVPSILLNDSTNNTSFGSGITEIIEGWYKLSLRPMSGYIAESILIHLIEPSKRSKTRILFDFDQLLMLTRKERVEANQKEVNSAMMTPNEGRISEGRLPLEGGDQLLINTALQPVDAYLQEISQNEGSTNEV